MEGLCEGLRDSEDEALWVALCEVLCEGLTD